MNSSPTDHELLRLFAMKADGTITPEDHEKLCQFLADSPHARREWFAFQDGEDALQSWSQRASLIQSSAPAQTQAAVAPVAPVKARTQRGIAWRITAAMAAGIVIGAVTWALWPQSTATITPSVSPSGSNVVIQDEATTSAVAVLTRGVDLVWEDNGTAPSLHEPLSPGELKLRSGVAEIEFFQGARLRIEGPAELKLVSAGEAFCKSGRFSADVPFHARGFRIGTPKGDLVDLGTEFGLDLTGDAPALHVFKGEVELHRPQTPMQLLTTGQAARMEGSDTMSADDTGFAFSRDLDSRVQASQRQSFDAWQQTAAQQLRDPALLLRLDFQDGAGARSLKNTAPQGPDVAAGTIVGCTWTQGRWPGTGKQALQFRSLSDRVRLKIPGQYRQLTAIASVQLNGLNIRQSSICMTQGLGAGYMHWQVLNDGSLCLGVGEGPGRPDHGTPVRWQDYISPVLFTPERFGQWVHLAMVYDLDAREVRFYLNGTRFSTHPIKEAVELSPGLMELGNWTPTPDKRQQPVRNFNGCMDEFSLISRALNDAEVRQLAR